MKNGNFSKTNFNPIQGTGKQVEYTILEDEIGITMDELQALIMALSYSHQVKGQIINWFFDWLIFMPNLQIVNAAVSLPEPVYQADELAKRGKNNFADWSELYFSAANLFIEFFI